MHLESVIDSCIYAIPQDTYLEVVVHPRTHKLSEGIICPLSDPAVNGHALCPKANGLRLEVTLLEEYRWR